MSCSSGNCPEEDKGIGRREFLSRSWWVLAGVMAIEATAGTVAFLWPKSKKGAFGSKVTIATVEEVRAMPVGTVQYFREERFYLSRVESGFLALYRKCTHVGCVVPWRPDDPSEDDLAPKGRFNCPCHQSIFNRYGELISGPALRPLDIFPIAIEEDEVVVDTGTILQRGDFDESQVTKV
ncbi:MAG: ubiquinol-cytochrome c reductase iron-sulfur subunit [Dehalococcoidia bacterium]